jgi:hypothetical protein
VSGMGFGLTLYVLVCIGLALVVTALIIRRNRPHRAFTCAECESPIRRGERYMAEGRHIEREDRLGRIKVEDAELVVAYHLRCVPKPAVAQ